MTASTRPPTSLEPCPMCAGAVHHWAERDHAYGLDTITNHIDHNTLVDGIKNPCGWIFNNYGLEPGELITSWNTRTAPLRQDGVIADEELLGIAKDTLSTVLDNMEGHEPHFEKVYEAYEKLSNRAQVA